VVLPLRQGSGALHTAGQFPLPHMVTGDTTPLKKRKEKTTQAVTATVSDSTASITLGEAE